MKSLKKLTAVTTAAALLALSPGLGCYEALALSVGVAAGKAVIVTPGGGAGAALALPKGLNLNPAGVLSPMAVGLTGSIKTLDTVVPTVRMSLTAPAADRALPRGSAASGRRRDAGNAAATIPGAAGRAIEVGPVAGNQGVSGARTSARVPTAALGRNSAVSPYSAKAVPTFKKLTAKPGSVSLSAGEIANMPVGAAKSAAASWMDRILNRRSHSGAALGVKASHRFAAYGARGNDLKASQGGERVATEAVPNYEAPAGRPRGRGVGGKILGVIAAAAKMALGAGAVYGLHMGAIMLLPSVFGALPAAAVWAISSGLFILPIALHARYRLGLRDSARLKGVKHLFDLSLGAFLGAVAVTVPMFMGGDVLSQFAVALPFVTIASFATAKMGERSGGVGGWIDAALVWASLNLLTPLIGSAGASALTLGGIFGLAAIPVLTTLSFFLGRIIRSAESGAPFSVPGSLQKLRFPAYTWVLTGVVFALLTGYSAVWVNAAFFAWMLMSNMRMATVMRLVVGRARFTRLLKYGLVRRLAGLKVFDVLFVSLAAWTAASGFAAPVTFLVLAFMPERASVWAEGGLSRLLPAGKPAPSTKGKTIELAEDKPVRFPRFHYWLKTGLSLGLLATMGFVMGATVFGYGSLLKNLGIAAVFSVIPLVFSKWIIKKVMKAQPLIESDAPEVYAMMRDLRRLINKDRLAKGKKPIPMPEMVRVPMPVPNAFATGLSPNKAMVGVTDEIMAMTLFPENTRALLVRLLNATEGNSKSFRVFRMAIRGSIPGIAEDATPQTVIQAVTDAPASQIKELGYRAMRGVLGHEFSHVMHRDMILGTIGGTIASGISFASYSVLWAVGHAEAVLRGIWERIKMAVTGKKPEKGRDRVKRLDVMSESGWTGGTKNTEKAKAEGKYKPEFLDPATSGAAVQAILAMVKIFAALWAPLMAKVLAMSSSRTREGHADEAGGALTSDHESLALGLGFLTAWRPTAGFNLSRPMMPRLASQAHIMTVNPLEQLYAAGVLKSDMDAQGIPVGKADDWFFQLFITHPNTTQRIERLYEMARAREAGLDK